VRFRDFRLVGSSPGPETDVPGRIHVSVVRVSTAPTQRNSDGDGRLALAACPQTGHCRPVWRGSTTTTSPPACCALYPTKVRIRRKAHPPILARCGLRNRVPWRMPLRFSRASPRPAPLALATGIAKARFAPRNGFELAPNTPGSPAAPFPAGCRCLQTTAQIVVTQATFLNRRARVALPIAVSGDVPDTQSDARNIGWRRLRAVWPINCHQQKTFAVLATHEVALPPGSRTSPGLAAPHDERRPDATGACQQQHPVGALETHHPLVVWNRCQRTEMRTPGLVALTGFADLRDTAHGHLCGQPVAIPLFAVFLTNASPASQSAAGLKARIVFPGSAT
jgi:hypothetical protein